MATYTIVKTPSAVQEAGIDKALFSANTPRVTATPPLPKLTRQQFLDAAFDNLLTRYGNDALADLQERVRTTFKAASLSQQATWATSIGVDSNPWDNDIRAFINPDDDGGSTPPSGSDGGGTPLQADARGMSRPLAHEADPSLPRKRKAAEDGPEDDARVETPVVPPPVPWTDYPSAGGIHRDETDVNIFNAPDFLTGEPVTPGPAPEVNIWPHVPVMTTQETYFQSIGAVGVTRMTIAAETAGTGAGEMPEWPPLAPPDPFIPAWPGETPDDRRWMEFQQHDEVRKAQLRKLNPNWWARVTAWWQAWTSRLVSVRLW